MEVRLGIKEVLVFVDEFSIKKADELSCRWKSIKTSVPAQNLTFVSTGNILAQKLLITMI